VQSFENDGPPHLSSRYFRERGPPGARATPNRQDIRRREIGASMATVGDDAMTDVVTSDVGKRGKDAAHVPVLVSGNKLTMHFGCALQHTSIQ
jgi:hypothetical protein